MKWVKEQENKALPIKSWCEEVEPGALEQAQALSRHPVIVRHVALMPDCHQGYGMPIGGVIACANAVIPNAVGVDIGCGMGAVKTDLRAAEIDGPSRIRELLEYIKQRVPVGEGHAHKEERTWPGFQEYLECLGMDWPLSDFSRDGLPGWMEKNVWSLARKNLGTLGGGNHFIELQKSEADEVWLMLHSGSRNLGYRIASFYHKRAAALNEHWHAAIPNTHLAFLPADSEEGMAYIRDMGFALEYARENRRLMMDVFKKAAGHVFPGISFLEEINIHHNYAALEHHFGQNVWVHRKGATSAKVDEMGIIPGSMGTSSYIVRGKGNPESFMSCSHGAGRRMSRTAACETLSVEECNEAMQGIVFDRWSKLKSRKRKNQEDKNLLDLSEAPLAYKDIDDVIAAELDLIEPVVKLSPLGVIKG
jgi:tRNA-splicing ligase RtcB